MHATFPLLKETSFPQIHRSKPEILQLNLGYRCNLSCLHCHVNAGPTRKEMMSKEVIDTILAFLENSSIRQLDLTGGAPELNDHFRYLIESARAMGIAVIDRCNLVILEEPGQEELASFLAQQKVKIVASLPCYMEENVNQQRGSGVFDSSILALQKLNALGYGSEEGELILDLVFNPQDATLPPAQEMLEKAYKKHLLDEYGISFNNLLAITNMPIKRFGSTLISQNRFDEYMTLLKSAYNESNLETIMCRTLISVDWQGYLYDCDFNQMLEIPLKYGVQQKIHISALKEMELEGASIQIADHCYGCTAGQGSSCSGSLD